MWKVPVSAACPCAQENWTLGVVGKAAHMSQKDWGGLWTFRILLLSPGYGFEVARPSAAQNLMLFFKSPCETAQFPYQFWGYFKLMNPEQPDIAKLSVWSNFDVSSSIIIFPPLLSSCQTLQGSFCIYCLMVTRGYVIPLPPHVKKAKPQPYCTSSALLCAQWALVSSRLSRLGLCIGFTSTLDYFLRRDAGCLEL